MYGLAFRGRYINLTPYGTRVKRLVHYTLILNPKTAIGNLKNL